MKDEPVKSKKQGAGETSAVPAIFVGFVVAGLVLIWGVYLVKKVRSGGSIDSPLNSGQDVFNFGDLDKATRDFADRYDDRDAEIRRAREEAAARDVERLPHDETPSDPFGSGAGF
jgi:hypothetical protein